MYLSLNNHKPKTPRPPFSIKTERWGGFDIYFSDDEEKKDLTNLFKSPRFVYRSAVLRLFAPKEELIWGAETVRSEERRRRRRLRSGAEGGSSVVEGSGKVGGKGETARGKAEGGRGGEEVSGLHCCCW